MSATAVAPSRRDVAYVAFLVVVLSVGVIGVLLFNTAMQQQSDLIAAQQQRIAGLVSQAQVLQTRLDWASDPARLAARAKRLHLQPVSMRETLYITPHTSCFRLVSTRTRTGGITC